MKLKEIDLNSELKMYDFSKPKFMQIDVETLYQKTGLPKFPPKHQAHQLAKEVFMAVNILRTYKQFTIALLEDYMHFFQGNNLVLDGFSINTAEG